MYSGAFVVELVSKLNQKAAIRIFRANQNPVSSDWDGQSLRLNRPDELNAVMLFHRASFLPAMRAGGFQRPHLLV